jgi:hypothetical protein
MLRSRKRLQPLVLPALVLVVIFGLVASRIMTASFAAVYPNPQIGQTCGGLDIALVADVSGSITQDQTEFTEMQTAFTDFVSSLPPGTNTLFSLTQFDTNAVVLEKFTNNAATLDNAINNFSGGGETNWVDGLKAGYSTFSGLPAPAAGAKPVPKLLIIATDGDPTVPRSTALSDAITEANTIKQAGVHVLAVGLGSSPTISNLEDITGTNLNTGDINTDVVTTKFDTLDAAMLNIASATCGGTGTGTGTGGTGNGTNGNGNGTGGTGNGSGTGGTGTGSNGTGSGNGDSATPQPSSSPQPAPVPDPNQHPIKVPVVVPNPQPSTAPVPSPSQTPNPAPAPKSQGNQVQPPVQSPSIFFDGKAYAPGSAPDSAGANVARPTFNWWYLVIGLVIAVAGIATYIFWQRRQATPRIKSKSRR